MEIHLKIKWTVTLFAMALTGPCMGAESDGLENAWGFDNSQDIVFQQEKYVPVVKPNSRKSAKASKQKKPEIKKGDAYYGNFDFVEGVRGNALKFDGFTTKVVRKASQAAPLGRRFTIEAWIAPQEFSLNQTAIINQEKDHKAGYFFGFDNQGHLRFQATIGGTWQTCTSKERLPILRWSHVAVTFDSAQGVTLYMDGKPVGCNPAKGEITPAKDTDLWIGMSQTKQTPVPPRYTDSMMFSWMVFDGLIDELKIHRKAFSDDEVQAAFAAVSPAVAQPLQYREMPSGPKDGKQFGAFYTRLTYAPEWERQSRVGDRADVVVTFEDPRANFVFWRGTSYIPHWVTDNEIWYNNQFVERRGNSDGCKGCVEPMSDKECRFSHVRVIHSSPARTVIHWRYAPVGLKLKHPYADPYSGLGDWVDETYTIYPDMVGVRSITLYSTAIDEFTDWQEAIVVHQPGRLPEDNIDATALSIGNLDGKVVHYTWPETGKAGRLAGLPDLSCIQIVNLKAKMSPFMIVPPSRQVQVKVFRGNEPHSMFRHWNHWPVAHGMSSTTPAFDASKPSHSSLSVWKNWELYRSTDNSKTHLMLHGMTDKGVGDLTGLAKSWIAPAEAKIVSGNYRSAGFDQEQKAYGVERVGSSKADALQLQLVASVDAPLVHPAIIVKDWPIGATAEVEVAGRKVKAKDIKIGVEQELEGSNLVVWLGLETTAPIAVEIKPVEGM